MIRVLAILLLSCVSLRAAGPFFFKPVTNDLVAIQVTANKGSMVTWLAGKTTTNTIYFGGPFWFNTNSTATIDLVDVFPSPAGGRQERLKIGPTSIGSGTPTSATFLSGDSSWTAKATLTAGAGLTGTTAASLLTPATLTVGAGTGITVNADDVALSAASITSLGLADTSVQPARQIISGGGLTGGGTLAADRTLAVGAGTGITVNADDVAVNQGENFSWTGTHGFGNTVSLTALTGPGVLGITSAEAITALAPPGVNGYVLSSQTDGTLSWIAAAGSGTVTSVALTAPTSVFDVAGSPITTSGTLALTFDTQTANKFFAGPSAGGAATPAFRVMEQADLAAGLSVVPGAGDMLYSPIGDTWDKLVLGSAGDALFVTGSSPDWRPILGSDVAGGAPTWPGINNFDAASTDFRSTGAFSTSPLHLLKGTFKYNSGGDFRTLAQITMGKENATDGNDAGYFTIGTRPNGGSTTARLNISSAGVVNISNLTASKYVATDASKNLISVTAPTANIGRTWSKVAETTIANTTTTTTFTDTGVGSLTIAGNTFAAGAQVRLRCGGFYTTKALTPGTFTIQFFFGGTATESILLSGLPANVSSTVGVWQAEYNWSVMTTGASGTIAGQGFFTYSSPGITDTILGNGAKRSSTACDTTADQVFDIKGTWQTADSVNSITCTYATIELMNN